MSKSWNDFVIKNSVHLDEKKQQTTYKIEYIVKYVEKWLLVQCNVPENKNINFIDSMCNAGIYRDGDKGTAIKVLELFNVFALQYPDKTFNLLLNDISADRLKIINAVINDFIGIEAGNIHILYYNQDVNDFISNTATFNTIFNCYPNRAANLVFVDPYNFCTVKLSALQNFLSNKYCELLYNVFTSDFVRNQDKTKMQQYCQEENIVARNKQEMVDIIKSRLRTGYIKHVFSYEFKTVTNNEIYQIMFFTPNIRGLEKLKEALWETFNGKEFYKNEKEQDVIQMSIFTEEDDKAWMITQHSDVAKTLLVYQHKGETLTYQQIEAFLLENTLLNGNQIINNVIKPLIDNKQINKLGCVKNRSNYKKDKYIIVG